MQEARAEGEDLGSLVGHFLSELDPSVDHDFDLAARRGLERRRPRVRGLRSRVTVLAELVREQAVRHAFLKQVRDAHDGELAVLQQVVEARSSVTSGSLRWRRLRGPYELSLTPLASHPLEDELGLAPQQTITRAFAAEFGFRMESGVVRWP